MNTPTKLTVLRIVLTPVFLLLLLWDFPWHDLVANAVFCIAAFTDFLDGNIARRRGLVTNLGKFLDPIADKLLTTAAFLGFLAIGCLDVWAVMLILAREFMVTSVRLMAAGDGTVVAASIWGKAKTVAQFISIIYMMVCLQWPVLPLWSAQLLVWIAVVLCWVSGLQYFWHYRHYFFDSKSKL